MKRFLPITFLLLFCLRTEAQQYPSSWEGFTTVGYYFDIESGDNSQNLDEARYKADLLNLARTNLSKQIQVRVAEMSTLNKEVIDGHSSISYASESRFSTDRDLKLAKTETYTDNVSGKVFAIVYINKREASQYYENELQMMLRKVDNAFQIGENYERQGFKKKAKEELQQALTEFDSVEESFFWLNIFGMPEQQLQKYLDQAHEKEQSLKSKLAELEHGVTYCIVCVADYFGKPYPTLAKEVKGGLSTSGCSFTEDIAAADFVILINATAREYNKANIAGSTAYFVYVDAAIVIDKNATGQRIYEDKISIKGSHTLGYEEAARDGYKNASKEIGRILRENIEL
jgi:hypothetical protein